MAVVCDGCKRIWVVSEMIDFEGRATSFYPSETTFTTKSESTMSTSEVCASLSNANLHHARSPRLADVPTSVHAKLHAGQQELHQDAIERCILTCSMPRTRVAGELHDLCSQMRHTKGMLHNELLTVVCAEISGKAVEQTY
jgi:hypothetical protein